MSKTGDWNPSKEMDRRQFVRIKAAHVIKYVGYYQERCHLITNIKDLSEGGVQFQSNVEFHNSDIIELLIVFSDLNDELLVFGRVAWVRQCKEDKDSYSCGISFLEMPTEDRLFLRRYVSSNLDQAA